MNSDKQAENPKTKILGYAIIISLTLLITFVFFRYFMNTSEKPHLTPLPNTRESATVSPKKTSEKAYKNETTLNGKITGHVTDYTTGLPIENVDIELGNSEISSYHSISDRDGRFTLSEIGDGMYVLKAVKSGFGTQFTDITITHETPTTVSIVLLPEATVFGSIIHAEGTPASSMKLTLCQQFQNRHQLTTISDEQGLFEFTGVTPGKNLDLAVHLPCGLTKHVTLPEVTHRNPNGPYRILLDETGSLTGSVYRLKPKALLPYIDVKLILRETQYQSYVIAKTGNDGKYEFKDIPIGQAILIVENDLYWYESQNIVIESGKISQQELYMKPPAKLSGRVIFQDESPAEDITITLNEWHLQNRFNEITTYSDSDGFFLFENLHCARNHLEFSRGNDLFETESWQMKMLTDIEPGQIIEKNFVLRKNSVHIVGKTQNPDGLPVEGVTLTLIKKNDMQILESTSDEDGIFDLGTPLLGSLRLYKITAEKPGYAKHQQSLSPDKIQNNVLQLLLVMSPSESISGHVETPEGIPLSNIVVTATSMSDLESNMTAGAYSDITRHDGRFHIDALEPGLYGISAANFDHSKALDNDGSKDEFYKSFQMGHESAVLWGVPSGTDNLKIVMESKGIIRLHVINAETQLPITEYSVEISVSTLNDINPEKRRIQVISHDGSVEIPNVPYGNAHLIVFMLSDISRTQVNAGEKTFTFTANQSPLDVEIIVKPPENMVTGWVYGKNVTDPLPDVSIQVMPVDVSNPFRASTRTNSAGYFELPNIDPGIYRFLLITTVESQVIQNIKTVTIEKNPEPLKLILFEDLSALYGIVIDGRTDESIPDARVMCDADMMMVPVKTDSEGCFVFQDLPKTVSTLTVITDGYAQTVLQGIDITRHSNPDNPLIVTMMKGVRLSGHIFKHDKSPLPNVQIELQPSIDSQENETQRKSWVSIADSSTIADGNGFYAFDNVAPGPHICSILQYLPSLGIYKIICYFNVENMPEMIKDFSFPKGYCLTGTLKANGVEMPGMQVLLYTPFTVDERNVFGINCQTQTNEKGIYLFENLPPGNYKLSAGELDFKKGEFTFNWDVAMGSSNMEKSLEINF
ncbi:carboxypeptidase regulatory-like domain-containing protein [bacterium]|nr:carboxypeptidase regulatory-like domain-containing protein [candidate division CSSED10-310 bacterium]